MFDDALDMLRDINERNVASVASMRSAFERTHDESELYGTNEYDNLIAQTEAAIRVLEAAGKVDKREALDWMQAIDVYVTPPLSNALYPLIYSLPDAPKEEK